MHIGKFICSTYYGSKGDTVHYSDENDIGQKLSPKTMGTSMTVYFSDRCPSNSLVLVFMYFIKYLAIACIDVIYCHIYIFSREKVCQSSILDEVP